MSNLRIIVGRAGSGKTHSIYEEMLSEVEKDPTGHPLWLIVPEQATFQAEQELSALSSSGGFMRLRVVSFKRLAHLVFQAVSGAALQPISEIGKQMLIRRIVEERKKELKLFSRAASQPGFCLKIMELLTELRSYKITPEHLKVLLGKESTLPTGLSNKISDLTIIYESLLKYYAELKIEDADDALDRLEDHVREYKDITGARIWFDGFSGFTPQEYAVMGRLYAVAKEVAVTLTIDPDLVNTMLSEEHFSYTPWETMKKLQGDAVALGLKSIEVVPLEGGHRFAKNSALRHLESCYFSHANSTFAEEPPGVSLVVAANRRAEVEAAAREITRLCREEGLRFRDTCVIVRDVDAYEELLATVFADHDIPFFLDRKRPVPHHPVIDLLRAVLEAVNKNYPYEPMLRFLKTDLTPLSRDEVDALDNYVLARGIRGQRWFDDGAWEAVGADNAEEGNPVDASRKRVAALLVPLGKTLVEGGAKEGALALYSLLSSLQVEKTLNDWAHDAEASSNLEEARLHTQVYQAVIELLQELVWALGDEEMDMSTFIHIVNTGLDSITLGLIPPGLDQVVVTILGRSRSPNVRAALVLGVNEGVFPARAKSEGIFSDVERGMLSSLEVGLGPTVRRQLFDEEYLIYTAFSRASEFLWLSFAQAREDGTALLPSLIIRRLQEMFPELKEKICALEPPEDDALATHYLAHPTSAAGMLATHMSRLAETPLPVVWQKVYNFLAQNERTAHLVNAITGGMSYNNVEPDLPRQITRKMYGTVLRGSVSRLERFRGCPFSYFAAYGLRLKERKVFKLAAPDLGNFFHEALDRLAGKIREGGLDWGSLDDRQHKSLSQEITAELAPAMQGEILSSNARYRYLTKRLQQTLERSSKVLGAHFRKGKFRPVGIEVAFGTGEKFPVVKFELPDGLSLELSGRIDRLDGASGTEGFYLRVVDYKSGNSRLTPLEVYYGLKVQLLIYLQVAVALAKELTADDSEKIIPAGALYFQIHDPLVRSEGPVDEDEAQRRLAKAYRPSGFVVAEREIVELMEEGAQGHSTVMPIRIKKDGSISQSDQAWTREQYEAMTTHLKELVREMGQGIAEGKVGIEPYRLDKSTACTYCAYGAVCKFDARLPENRYRSWDKIASPEVWHRLGVGGGEGDADVDR